MVISDLVNFIQATYPPTDGLPQPQDGRSPDEFDDERELEPDLRWPPNLPGIDRPPLPDWVLPGEGAQLEEDVIPSLEDQPIAPGGPPPANPDVLAYYLPFHFYRVRWGIYVRASGLLAVASMLAGASGRPAAQFLDLAYQTLVQHERFHFYTEVACSRAEIASRSPLYRSYFAHRRAAALEEALANAQAIRIALKGQGLLIQTAIETWMRSQGPGYRDFGRWVTRGCFSEGRQLISGVMIRLVSGTGPPGPTEFLYESLSRTRAPIYMVCDTAGVGALKPFPKYLGIRILVHTNDHPPPHVHVQISDGRAVTRLQWPSLQPVKGDPTLSTVERSTVDSYLQRYGAEIGERVQRVYGAAA
jgi:hypothetical protein